MQRDRGACARVCGAVRARQSPPRRRGCRWCEQSGAMEASAPLSRPAGVAEGRQSSVERVASHGGLPRIGSTESQQQNGSTGDHPRRRLPGKQTSRSFSDLSRCGSAGHGGAATRERGCGRGEARGSLPGYSWIPPHRRGAGQALGAPRAWEAPPALWVVKQGAAPQARALNARAVSPWPLCGPCATA